MTPAQLHMVMDALEKSFRIEDDAEISQQLFVGEKPLHQNLNAEIARAMIAAASTRIGSPRKALGS